MLAGGVEPATPDVAEDAGIVNGTAQPAQPRQPRVSAVATMSRFVNKGTWKEDVLMVPLSY